MSPALGSSVASNGPRRFVAITLGLGLLPDGTLIGKIRVPEAAANLAFGGSDRSRLYITATTSLYAVFTNVRGSQRP